MGYKVPDDDAVLAALEEVLTRHGVVESQHRLTDLVREELQRDDHELTVSQTRVRRLALDGGLAVLEVTTGTTARPVPEACPVCGAQLRLVENRTLSGATTVVGSRCARCPYRSGAHLEVPLRYRFSLADDPRADEARPTGPF